ncbi:MAG: hypothetical protein PUF12_07915 [Thermoflexaceae bacterium]|nr:hypothetical protein [Thermoflexaceae bacterium]
MIAVMTETGKLLEIMKNVEETGGYNMCKAIDEMVKAGERRGMEQGETQLGLLISRLFADGRTNDVQKVATDERIRKEFYREYGIAE